MHNQLMITYRYCTHNKQSLYLQQYFFKTQSLKNENV